MEFLEVETTLGRYALALGNLNQASFHFERVLQGTSGTVGAAIGLARVRMLTGELDRAAIALEEFGGELSQSEEAALLEARAELLMARYVSNAERTAAPANGHGLHDARSLLERAVGQDPERAGAWWLLGETYALEEAVPPERGIEALRTAKRLVPARLEIDLALGVLLQRQGNHEAARGHITRALASHDSDLVAEANRVLDAITAAQ